MPYKTPRLFATTETQKIQLFPASDDHPGVWVEVKKYLSYGESRRLATAALQSMSREDVERGAEDKQNKFWLDFEKQAVFKLAVYVVSWNLWDESGKTVKLPADLGARIEVMRNLSPEVGDIISSEIDRLIAFDSEMGAEQMQGVPTEGDSDPNQLPPNVVDFAPS